MAAKSKPSRPPKSTAKVFMHGRSQAVRLPAAFRFEGKEVRVSKVGDKVILEPLTPPPFDFDAWLEKLASYGDLPDLELPVDPPSEPDDTISFD